jgi:hypothetical protein
MLAVALTFSACATASGARAQRARDTIFVDFTNANWLDMTVYLINASGHRRRLGTVTTNQTRTFLVEASALGGSQMVQFAGDPIGSTEWFYAPAMMVHPGQRAVWMIANQAAMSTAWVR